MKALGTVIYLLAGVAGYIGGLGLVVKQLGFIWGFIAFLFVPMTIAFAPWYSGFAFGNWKLLAIVYGGAAVGSVCYIIGDKKA